MKIIKYTKVKKNQYKLMMDDGSILELYDEVILNNNLLITKVIDKTNLSTILKENEYYVAYYKAIKYLNIKMRSKHELVTYLSKDFNSLIVKNVIDKLTKEGYINDDLYASLYVNDQIKLSNNGYNKILRSLNYLEIPEEYSKKYLDKISSKIWIDKINKLIGKKIKLNKKSSSVKLKEKIIYDLGNLGYNRSDIIECLDNYVIEDSDGLFKAYNLYLTKLSKKYSGKELDLHLLTKLISLGFNYNDIKKIMAQKKE